MKISIGITSSNVKDEGESVSNKNSKKRKRTICIIIAIVMSAICIISSIVYSNQFLKYSELIDCIKNGEVISVNASLTSNKVTIRMKDDTKMRAIIPSLDEFTAFVSEQIEEGHEIDFSITDRPSAIWRWFCSILKFVLIAFGIMIVILGLLFVAKDMLDSKDNVEYEPVTSRIKFADVAGIEEEKEQLVEIVEFLKNPDKYVSIGAKIPKGVLLYGEPGTGKTLLAKAIAGEAGVPFFQANGSSFDEIYVGVGALRIRKLFKEAKAVAPSIIFIDEIDSVAKKRNKNSLNDGCLNQILSEMDGFDTKDNVIIIAATNRIEMLDDAITRAGRFDRKVYVPKPDAVAREAILNVHAQNKKLSEEVSVHEIARKTTGFSGADLETLLNEAAILAVKNDRESIIDSDIDEAIARTLVGLKKKITISDEEKWLTAVHEAGHAIVSAIVRPKVKNMGISIVPRGNAGGYNAFDIGDKTHITKNEIINSIMTLYGGRIAEEVLLGDISTGASEDLKKASEWAFRMVSEYSMSDKLMVRLDLSNGMYEYEEYLELAEKICKKAYEETEGVVKANKEFISKLAALLLDKEYLSQEEVGKFLKENGLFNM